MPMDSSSSSSTSTWQIARIPKSSLSWGTNKSTGQSRCCPHCGLELLTGETPGFCCGTNGDRLRAMPPLQPLPAEFASFLSDRNISALSRKLNLIYSFAQLESTAEFPRQTGPRGNVCFEGRLFHRVRPDHKNCAVRWFLHDGFMRSSAPFSDTDWFLSVPSQWIDTLGRVLLRDNSLVRHINVFKHSPQSNLPSAHLVIKDAGANEVAAVMCFDNTIRSDMKMRTVIISRKASDTQRPDFATTIPEWKETEHRISAFNRFWEPLAYPLFFPHGELGWGLAANTAAITDSVVDDATSDQLWYYRLRLLHDEHFQIFGQLTNEYLCDMFTRNIETRLSFIRRSQLDNRRDDAELMGSEFVPSTENIFLPESFLGSAAWRSVQIADALTIAAHSGPPTFFITMTCNPNWPEIRERLRPGQEWHDVPIVVARVFKQKVGVLLKTLKTMFSNAGRLIYLIYNIEFQKRGLPHIHVLIKFEKDCVTPEDIDAVVSAEIPDDPVDAELVRKLVMHNHRDNRGGFVIPKYCERKTRHADGSEGAAFCRFGYPKPLQDRTTIAVDGRPQYRRRKEGDEYVVPYCLPLLRALDCHINFEVANTSQLFQYLFKYVNKGVDRAWVRLRADGSQAVDEIEDYWRGRYLSAGEAAWRIMGYHISRKSPGVTCLPVHVLESKKHHQYQRRHKGSSTMSALDRYFHRPEGDFVWDGETRSFASLTYAEYNTFFRFETENARNLSKQRRLADKVYFEANLPPGEKRRMVIPRAVGNLHYARLEPIRPSDGERFYLRSILAARPAASFADARCAGGVHYETYQEAAEALGLFANEREAELAMREAVDTLRTPAELRLLFVHILVHDNGQIRFPLKLWEAFRVQMSMDHFFKVHGDLPAAESAALEDIARHLEEHGRNLSHFNLPEPASRIDEVTHEFERWVPHADALANAADRANARFTPEQAAIFNEVVDALINNRPKYLFIDGKSGRGKTFLINAILNFVRSRQEIALPTASSAFAALLYDGGRTTHSTFKVPVDEFNELLRSPIERGDSRAQLIDAARVIIWDEAPMANRAVLACVEETCRRATGCDLPFGGKIVILAGDFRQTCPVIRKGTRAQVVDASIRSSPLWPLFEVRRLTVPIRNAEDLEFADWVDTIGDGAGPQVSLDFLRKVATEDDMIDFVFPQEVIDNPAACLKRSILCPTNKQIDAYNERIMRRVTGISKTYMASDRIKEHDAAEYESEQATIDYAARVRLPGIPAHTIDIKTNGVYRMLRNFSIDRGLVKNVRCVVKAVGRRLITIRILRDVPGGAIEHPEDILIPRISFEIVLPESRLTLQRRQFPLAAAYATTFNSCQGLTLDYIAVDLIQPVFSHGQLYTAISRVGHRNRVVVRLPPGESCTTNVTYSEILL